MAEPVKQPDTTSPKPAAPAKPKASMPKQSPGKPRLEALNVNLGRCGVRQESALPVKKAAPKLAPGSAKPAGVKPAPGAKPAAPVAKAVPAAPKRVPVAKPAPKAKKHYFIIENLCVGCGLCLDKCPPKVNAIGYKFYGDVQEGGFRCYIDQNVCISCSACFSGDECPSGALIEVLPDGQVLDFSFTPPERLDFDLRFLHRFHREAR